MKLDIAVPLNVKKVLRRLKRFNYQSYLVGGCVRDTLIGKAPKDWDIATDATPEEVREVFDNCRIVGKRFPIAHVCFSDGIIEVVTFRNAEDYGTLSEDVYRRDFTVNSLYWEDGEIIDPFTGLEDMLSMSVVCIGNPDVRFADDPVRMLRAVRLMQLGFTLTEDVREGIERNHELLKTVNKSRLYCEFSKAVVTDSIMDLHEMNLLQQFFPHCMYDSTVYMGGEQDTCTVICSIIWEYFCDAVGGAQHEFNLYPIPASQKAAKLVTEKLRQHMDIDRKMSAAVKQELAVRYKVECT